VTLTVVNVVAPSSRDVSKMATSFNLQLPETTEEQVRSIAEQEQRTVPEIVVMLTDEAIRTRRPRAPWIDRLSLNSYQYAEAARYAETSPQTVASWCRRYRTSEQQTGADGVSRGKGKEDANLLSYLQLIEVALVAAFRRVGIKMDAAYRVHEDLRAVFQHDNPFALPDFKDRYPLFAPHPRNGRGIWQALETQDGQRVWTPRLAAQFERFDDDVGLAIRWYPRGRDGLIVIDPRMSFGAPTIADTGVPTYALKGRYLGGEELEETADDFGLSMRQLQAALEFEGVFRATS